MNQEQEVSTDSPTPLSDSAPSKVLSLSSHKNMPKILAAAAAFGIIVVLLAGFWILMRSKTSPQSKTQKQKTEQTVTKPYIPLTHEIMMPLHVGAQIAVNKDWDITVLDSRPIHNFVIASVDKKNRVEIEAFSPSFKDWEKYIKSPFVRIEKTESKVINGLTVVIEKGTESFLESKRDVITGTWTDNGKILIIRVYSTDGKTPNSLFNNLAQSVSFRKELRTLHWDVMKPAYAAEVTPKSLPPIAYTDIEVMGEPFTDEITDKEPVYKDGFVKGYRFTAYKSQKLEIYMDEDRASNSNSFIQSRLYDSVGEPISSSQGTFIEFNATYSGDYFLLVSTFKQQTGKFELRIDDKNQLGCRSTFIYPDGAELALTQKNGYDLTGAYDVALVFECPTPIELLDEHRYIYETPARRQKEQPKQWTGTMEEAIISNDPDYLIKPKQGNQTSFQLFDDKDFENTTRISLQVFQLASNRILIKPKDGLFPKNHQVQLSPSNQRFFTQDEPKIPDIPILKEIVQDYSNDFAKKESEYNYETIRGEYFDWTKNDGTIIELMGAVIQYRKFAPDAESGNTLLNRFKQYFLDKGYTVSEKNTLKTTDSNGSPKDVSGLEKGSTVCTLVNPSFTNFMIYCSILSD
ncbi:hypothetical protein A3B02_00675 [Candidatus Roizmanbacteria bacterium RIFCSPLOWO2_01_FULL_42_14]|uniref:Uncharacterized protein n=1 Tax=Candidatus Roizmanbacteria bacterium RIFCSPLOWO2_01_FULL_42_14 TaxID=1802068 RepID=A0A1F7J7R6_9BACT|nr:MAG: hypothetical protein A3B02_00675 [Candidatus Roizmanbacteria bacterium RIFCSPLOWO2_01_FULL_42_14]